MSDTKTAPQSKLIHTNLIEGRDELDEKLEKCYNFILSVTRDLSEREANDTLQAHTSRGNAQHDDIQFGFFYGILTDPKMAPKYYRDMMLVNQDGLGKVINTTNQLVYEKWIRFTDTCRLQVLWLTKELVRSSVAGSDSICHTLLRQIAGGDMSAKNIWLTETLLDIFTENRPWLDKCAQLLPVALYTYLRILTDHNGQSLQNLRQREVEFCMGLLRERWLDCQSIGRDLIRLLQGVARVPEFEALWKDLLFSPASLHPQFTGIKQLLQMKTSRRFFLSRLTPDMENKLVFLTSRVKFGNQKRYQDWFQRQYLSTPESQSLRCDLIRYICAVIHPSNDVLCSDIIPRWAVIGWLLTTCTSNVAACNAKLALFFDWLFFDAEKDSIMNIEPCILVMHHSMRPHPAITATLLDFMCRIMPNFYPPLTPLIKQGIFASLHAILDKRVLPSLSPLFDNAKLDKELRATLRENFSEFCTSAEVQSPASSNAIGKDEAQNNHTGLSNNILRDSPIEEITLNNHTLDHRPTTPPSGLENSLASLSVVSPAPLAPSPAPSPSPSVTSVMSEFSDDEEITPTSTAPRAKLKTSSSSSVTTTESRRLSTSSLPDLSRSLSQPSDISSHLNNLNEPIRRCVEQIRDERDKEAQCELMDELTQLMIRQEEEFDQEDSDSLAVCLCHILASHFNTSIFPHELDEESLEDSIGAPLFVIFRNLSQTPEDDPSRQPLLSLLEEMYKKQPRVGYYFLYFLKVGKVQQQDDEKMLAYKDLCRNTENQSLESCLMNDLRLCQEDDVGLFGYLVPDVFSQFQSITVGNIELMHLVVSSIDTLQLQDLICEILQGHLIMFKKESVLSILNASLEWESIEQFFLWQLLAAHDLPIDLVLSILPKLDYTAHAEALSSILIFLKQDCPSADVVRALLCRECKVNDLFTVSVLKYWAQEYEDKLADLIHTQLTKANGTPNKKRHRQQQQTTPQQQSLAGGKMKDKDQPSTEQILAHLDHMRLKCRNISFLTHELVQSALQHIQTSCTDALKAKYSDLLALVEEFDESSRSTRVLRQVPSRRASKAASKFSTTAGSSTGAGTSSGATKSGKKFHDSDTSSESSDDDENIHVPRSKKSKRSNAIFNDD